MIRISGTIRVAAVLAVIMAAGCSMVNAPPSIAPEMPRRGITPRSYRMKLAVFNMQDPTGLGGRLSEGIAETLHVALFETGRFELMQRAEVRGINSADTQRIQDLYRNRLDGLVTGSITHFDTTNKMLTLNISVMNPLGTVMAAKAWDSIRYTGAINVSVNREDILEIANWIDRRFPKLATGQILSRSSERVTINLGAEDGVQVGMWVLIAARGDDVKDPNTGELLGSDIYVGEAFVVAVNEGTSGAVLATVNDRSPNVTVGDKVIFK